MQTPDKRRLGAFLLGGVIGAVAGVLFAPRSGRETWSTITDRAGEARERSREAYFDAQERMRERLARSRETPERSVEEEKVEAGPSETHERTPDHERLREKIRETRARLRAGLGEDEDGGGSA